MFHTPPILLQSTEEDLCAQLQLVKEQLQIETQQKERLTLELTSQLANSMRENGGLLMGIL